MTTFETAEEKAAMEVVEQLGTVTRLFGRPPLISSEKLSDYDEMMRRLFACMRPEDFVVSLLVYQVGIETWCAMRWRRFQALIVNRWEQNSAAAARQHETLQEQRKAQSEPPELFKDAPNESCRQIALSPLWDRIAEDVNTLDGCTNEIKLVAAFERATDKLQKAAQMISDCLKQRDSALAQIQWYKVSLAREVRRASDAAITDGSKKQIEVQAQEAPLAPKGESL